MKEFGIHRYYQSAAPRADLVLVHGLMGNSTDTWTGKDDQGRPTYWPDWIREQRPDVNIWLVDYGSSLNAWFQSEMSLDEIGSALLMDAFDEELGCRPIHWVGHSMGGLIIKHLLCKARGKADVDWQAVSSASRAITFLGTPHHGADLAKWEQYFSWLLGAWDVLQTGGAMGSGFGLAKRALNSMGLGNRPSHVQQLRAHGKELGDLNDSFAQWLGATKNGGGVLRVRNYYETLPVFKLVTVVPRHSAQLPNALVEEAPVRAHHFGICKFRSPDSKVFQGVLKSFKNLAPNVKPLDSSLQGDEAKENLEPSGVPDATHVPGSLPLTSAASGVDDLTDLAWRNALRACSAEAKGLVCQHLAAMLGSDSLMPSDLEQAIARAFAGPAYERVGNLRAVLRVVNSSFDSYTDSEQLIRLYWMLLVRAAALACIPAVHGANPDDFRVPDEINRLAITIAAHLIFGQGVELTFGPTGVEVENLIDMAALPDEPAQHPAQRTAYSGLRQEVREWAERVRSGTHTPGTTQMLKGAMTGQTARPLLLDRDGKLTTRAIRELARELGIGIVQVESDGRPASISPEHWQDLCQALRIEVENLAAGSSSAAVTSGATILPIVERSVPQSPPVPPFQLNLHQTFAGPVGQSNVTTGDHSPIHAQHHQAGLTTASEDALALAFVGFEMTLGADASLKGDLHALRDLVMRKDATPAAMHLLVRLLPPLRQAAEVRPEAGDAWHRLRHAVHAHWPEIKPFL